MIKVPGGTMIQGTNDRRNSTLSVTMNFLTRWLGGGIEDERFWLVVVVIVLSVFLFWSTALVYAYWADDITATPADERSVPAPQSY
jgi:hypothetical protein